MKTDKKSNSSETPTNPTDGEAKAFDPFDPARLRLTEATQIGVVGETGVASRPTLFFSILDAESGAYVNPLLLLPVVDL